MRYYILPVELAQCDNSYCEGYILWLNRSADPHTHTRTSHL
jgi:hypothetical protein